MFARLSPIYATINKMYKNSLNMLSAKETKCNLEFLTRRDLFLLYDFVDGLALLSTSDDPGQIKGQRERIEMGTLSYLSRFISRYSVLIWMDYRIKREIKCIWIFKMIKYPFNTLLFQLIRPQLIFLSTKIDQTTFVLHTEKLWLCHWTYYVQSTYNVR